MVRIEKINAKNVWDILKLHVSKEQEPFVAPNGLSLIEAYIAIIGNGHAFPFGVFEDEVPVGFVMVGYDVDESFENPPQIAYGNYSIWRLMIDEKYQRRGYGRQALRLALEFVRTFPCGKAEYCYLSYEPENAGAKRLYSEFGFQENGEMDGEEIVAVLKLSHSEAGSRERRFMRRAFPPPVLSPRFFPALPVSRRFWNGQKSNAI